MNIARRITDRRRTRKGKIALAVWMAIKFAYGNSTKYGISKDDIKAFLHCGDRTAKTVIKVLWDNPELFYVNIKKNCVFAKSCKTKVIRIANRKTEITFRGDDVMTIPIPECYSRKETDTLKNILLLLDYLLIAKEYDKQAEYKSSGHGASRNGVWGTEVQKSQAFTAKKVGLNRTTYYRRVKDMMDMGFVSKSPAHLERSTSDNQQSFKAVNKRTHLPYWLVSIPVTLELTTQCPFVYRHIIWDSRKRTMSKMAGMKKTSRFFDGTMSEKERVEYYFSFLHD